MDEMVTNHVNNPKFKTCKQAVKVFMELNFKIFTMLVTYFG